MGPRRRALSLVTLFLLVFLVASVAALGPQEESPTQHGAPLTLLTMAIPEHPFSYQRLSEGGPEKQRIEIAGIDIDLMERFAREIGRELVVENYSSLTDMFAALVRGRGDVCAAGLAVTPKRSAKGLPSIPYYRGKAMVVARKDHPYEGREALKRAKIGVLGGSVFEEILAAEFPNAKLVPSQMHLDNLVAVSESEVEFTLMDEGDIEKYFDELPDLKRDLEVKEEFENALTVAAFFSKASPELVSSFNSLLRRMEASGELQEVIAKHFGQ